MFQIAILLLLTFAFGPAMGASFCLASGLSPSETALAVSAVHLLLVPVWFAIFRFLKYELLYRRKVFEKFARRTKLTAKVESLLMENIRSFERGLRRWCLGTGLFLFTFMMGVSWSALLASLLNIRVSTIFLSVAAGALASSLFWTATLSGVMPFLPETWMIYLVTGVITLGLLLHGKVRESKAVREMAKSLRRLGIKIEEVIPEAKER